MTFDALGHSDDPADGSPEEHAFVDTAIALVNAWVAVQRAKDGDERHAIAVRCRRAFAERFAALPAKPTLEMVIDFLRDDQRRVHR